MPAPKDLIVAIWPKFDAKAASGAKLAPLMQGAQVRHCLVFIEPIEPFVAGALEATYLSGLLPGHHGQVRNRGKHVALPPDKFALWTRARARRPGVQCRLLPPEEAFYGLGNHSGLIVTKLGWPGARDKTPLGDIEGVVGRCLEALAKTRWALCLLGVPADQSPRTRMALLGVGFGVRKNLIGACEVAGILDEVLTGVELVDKPQ